MTDEAKNKENEGKVKAQGMLPKGPIGPVTSQSDFFRQKNKEEEIHAERDGVTFQSGRKPIVRASPKEYVSARMQVFSRRIYNTAHKILNENSPFLKEMEAGNFDTEEKWKSRVGSRKSHAGSMPDPDTTMDAALAKIGELEEKMFLHEGRLEKLDSMTDDLHECMVRYLEEIGDPISAKVAFRIIKNSVGPIANKWALNVSMKNPEGDPDDPNNYMYEIDYGAGNGGTHRAIWAASAIAERLFEFGKEHRELYQSILKGIDAVKTKKSGAKLYVPNERDPSLLLRIQELRPSDVNKITTEMKDIEKEELQIKRERKKFVDTHSNLIMNILTVGLGEKKAEAIMKKRGVKKVLGELESALEDGFNYRLTKTKLERIRDIFAREGSKVDYSIIVDRLGDVLCDMRNELEGYRSIDKYLIKLSDRVESFAATLGISDGFMSVTAEMLDEMLEDSGGSYSRVLEVFGNRTLKVLEESVKNAMESSPENVEKLKKELESLQTEVAGLTDMNNYLVDGIEVQGKIAKAAQDEAGPRYRLKLRFDAMATSIYSIFVGFDKILDDKMPWCEVNDAELGNKNNLYGSIRRVRKLLQNITIVFGGMEKAGLDTEGPGRYLMGPISRMFDVELNSVSELLGYVSDAIKFYIKAEKDVLRKYDGEDGEREHFYGRIAKCPKVDTME